MALNSIEEIIEDIRLGKMVILMDDEDRENEGDLIMAASMVRPEDINFMARYGRGLICLTLTKERCKQLSLPLMVADNQEQYSTAFTLSIEAAEGVTTGISAYDRAHTVRAAVQPNAAPTDIVQPGHIFPLMAQPGGVLTRAGHTEAGCDLARSAGLEPAAAIVEILNEDGTMARRSQLEVFAQEHGIKIGTIADLIHYRIANEKTVEKVAECALPTQHGDFRLVSFQDTINKDLHLALVKGDIDPHEPTLVRVHVQHSLGDVLGAKLEDSGWSLRAAMEHVNKAGKGVVVVLGKHEDSAKLLRRIRELSLQAGHAEAHKPAADEQLRSYGIGAQILAELGVRKMRVLSAPKNLHGISGFGLEVVEYIPE